MKDVMRIGLTAVFALLLTACGGGSDEEEILSSTQNTSSTQDNSSSQDNSSTQNTTTYVATIYASQNATLASVLAGLIDGVDLDSSGNAQITQSAIDATTALAISGKGLTSLTGIEYFVNLTSLDFHNNSVSEVDLSALTLLTSLNCADNLLTSLDLEKLTLLTTLDCSGNQLTSLDISMLSNLTSLTCGSQTTGDIILTALESQKALVTESDVLFVVTTSGTGMPNYENKGNF